MNPNDKALVCLYSDANFLAVNILESLLSNNCLVNIITDDIKTWKEKTEKIVTKNKFAFCEKNKVNKNQKYSYVIYCGGFVNSNKLIEEYKYFCSSIDIPATKTIILLPFELFGNIASQISINEFTAVIYVGDLIGPRMDLNSGLLMAKSISEIINERSLSLSIGEVFYPVFAPEVVKTIIKWMFAFGPYGKESFIVGSEVPAGVFWQKNMKLVGDINLEFTNKIKARALPKGKEIQRVSTNLDYCLTETYKWLIKNISKSPKKKIVVSIYRKKISSHSFKKINKILLSVLLFLSVPFLTFLIFVTTSFVAYKEIIVGKDVAAKNTIQIGRIFAVIGSKESKVLSYIPLLGMVYKETGYVNEVAVNLSRISEESIPVVRKVSKLFDNIFGTSIYNPLILLEGTRTSLQNIDGNIQSIHKLTDTSVKNKVILAKFVLSRVDFNKYEKIVGQFAFLVERIPEILGNEKNKSYLLLFENNMELRPTGGFIGSYGLVTLDRGRLSDFVVSDVYSADGQLNGHVEPPAPIRDYLNEANWWLRDSNWDPDFPTSAKRAEWFLDKEIDRQVDGVIAIDLTPIKNILELTGPIFLSDYNLEISSQNLYEKVQSEVQNNFFPGTHKKASFLTALSRSILDKMKTLDFTNKIKIFSIFYKSFEERHLQIFIHDSVAQSSISNLGWDGSVSKSTCGENCYSDMVGIVEANVGVNKANYFIERSANLEIKLNSTQIDRKLVLKIKNSANPELGLAGKYKVYIRFLVPADAVDFKISKVSGENRENLLGDIVETKGRKEVGTLVEVLGGKNSNIEISWNTPIGQSIMSSYELYIRKQAGVDGYPINIRLGLPTNTKVVDSKFTLTKDGSYGYNTNLVQDLFAHFSFKQ